MQSWSWVWPFATPHALQQARLPCPSLSPRVCSNSYPLSQWYHPTISSSASPFSSCPQSFQTSGSSSNEKITFCIRWPKYWSFSFSISSSSEYSGLISFRIDSFDHLVVLLKVFSGTTVWKHQFFGIQSSLWSNSHVCIWLQEKPELWLYGPLSSKWYLCFLMCCLCCHSFSSKKQASFNFMAVVTIHSDLGAQEEKNLSLLLLFPLPFSVKSWDWMPRS